MGYVGILVRNSLSILVAHVIGFVTYAALFAGLVADVASRQGIHPTRILASLFIAGAACCGAKLISRWSSSPHESLIVTAVGLVTFLAMLSVDFDGLRNATVLITISILHALMALGTASHRRQERIERDLKGGANV